MRLWQKRLLLPAFSLETAGISFSGQPLGHGSAMKNERIARQEILSERSQLSAGTKPPTVEVKLPQQVKTGQQYNFDAIQSP